MPKYPDITVKLIGENSNAFNILGICIKAMRRAGLPEEQVDEFRMEEQIICNLITIISRKIIHTTFLILNFICSCIITIICTGITTTNSTTVYRHAAMDIKHLIIFVI